MAVFFNPLVCKQIQPSRLFHILLKPTCICIKRQTSICLDSTFGDSCDSKQCLLVYPECWWEADPTGVPRWIKGRSLDCASSVTLWWPGIVAACLKDTGMLSCIEMYSTFRHQLSQ